MTEQDLHNVVKDSVIKILSEQEHGDLSINADSNLKVVFIEKKDIMPLSDFIWQMLVSSYENIGGLKTYRSKEDFLRKVKYAKIVYNNADIVACAIYRNMEGSYKMVAIGCNQEDIGKQGIQAIIKDDIEKFDYHFWAEVSGAIEHYFRKYNGYPMPNILAPEILSISSELIRLSKNDNVHYERQISNEWFEKMIFGAKSKEVYEAAIAAVEDYSKFMKEVNKVNENSNMNGRYSVKQAMYIVENIYRAHEEDGYNELIPSWYEALNESMEVLLAAEQTQTVVDYIEYCNYLLETMPVLQLHPLKI
jgi:hypothetical protein